MPPNQAVEQQIDEMRADMREMRGAITKMADALTKLSVLEERNSVASVAINKTADRTDKIEVRIVAVELEHAKFESKVSAITGTMKIMWGVFGTGVLYIGAEALKRIV